jgi:hypothetical protein
VRVPETVSPEAQEFMRPLKDPALTPAFPNLDDVGGWQKVQAMAEADGNARSEPLLKRYKHTATKRTLAGVPVLEVLPENCLF